MIQSDITNLIVITRFPVVEIDTHQVTVQTDVELLLLMSAGKMTDIERIAKEYPSPSEIRTDAVGHLRRKRYRLSRLTTDAVGLVGIGVLQHHGIVVMLRFDIGGVDFVEVLEVTSKEVSHLMGNILLACHHFHGRGFRNEHDRIGHVIHGGNLLYHRHQQTRQQPFYLIMHITSCPPVRTSPVPYRAPSSLAWHSHLLPYRYRYLAGPLLRNGL